MDLEKMTQKLNRAIEPMDDLTGALEAMALTIVSRVAGWAASIPNMIMVQRSATSIFQIEPALGYIVAISLELIGQSLVSHWNRTLAWNATRRKADLVANVELAFGLMVVYFAIDVAMVGALALTQYLSGGEWPIFLSLAYPLVGIITAIVTNERATLFRLQKARQIERQDAREKRNRKRNPKAEQNRNGLPEPLPELVPETEAEPYTMSLTTKARAFAILAERSDTSGAELGRKLGRSGSLGRRLKREWEAEHEAGNGHH